MMADPACRRPMLQTCYREDDMYRIRISLAE